MLLRKARKASNTWYRLGRPMIESGEQAGQRDQERSVVSIQIVPEGVLNEYGDRKVTGFTLSEIAKMVETGTGMTIWSNPEDQIEGLALAKIEVGDGMYQVTITELKQILAEMGGNVLSAPSPLDEKDRARIRGDKDPEVKVVVVQAQAGPPPGSGPVMGSDGSAEFPDGTKPGQDEDVAERPPGYWDRPENGPTEEETDADQTGDATDEPASVGTTGSKNAGARASTK